MYPCAHVVTAPITPGQVEILITTEGLCWYWYREDSGHQWPLVTVTVIQVQTRDRITTIIERFSKEKRSYWQCDDSDGEARRVGGFKCTGGLSGELRACRACRALILDLESWNNRDNVTLTAGAAPEDPADGAGEEAHGALHRRHRAQTRQARGHVLCLTK